MAIAISRIEKDWFLEEMYSKQIPIIHLRNRTEYTLLLEKSAKEQMYLISERPITGLWPRGNLQMMVALRGMLLSFGAQVISFKDEHIVTERPKTFYKQLERSYARMLGPVGLQIHLSCSNQRYTLVLRPPGASETENDSFEGRLINISLSGLLFACPIDFQTSELVVGMELSVKLVVKDRVIQCTAKIIRQYNDSVLSYFGIRFLGLQPEDSQFFFTFLYSTPFMNAGDSLLMGQV